MRGIMKKLVIATAVLGMGAEAVFAEGHQGNRGKAAEMSEAIGSVRDSGNVGQTTHSVSGKESRSGSGWGNQGVGESESSVSDGKPGKNKE